MATYHVIIKAIYIMINNQQEGDTQNNNDNDNKNDDDITDEKEKGNKIN